VRYNYGAHLYVDRDLTTKTRELLQERTESGNLELPGAIHALGVRELAALKHSGTTDAAKVLNLRKALMTAVAEEGGSKPFLHSIGERAEALVELYEDRQLTTRQALDDLMKLAMEVAESEEERARLDLDENAYAVYSALKDAVPTGTEATAEGARALDAIFRRYPDYQWDEQQGAALRADLYKETRALVGKDFIGSCTHLMKRKKTRLATIGCNIEFGLALGANRHHQSCANRKSANNNGDGRRSIFGERTCDPCRRQSRLIDA